MASGTETPLKPRRPTAFEVSFPNEYDDGHEDEYEDAVDEGNDLQRSRHNGKRKLDSSTTTGSDGRVRVIFCLLYDDATHTRWGSVAY